RVNGIDVPEFLRTHPLDTRRIAEARERAAQLGCPATPAVAARSAPAPGGGLDLNLPAGTPLASNDLAGAAGPGSCAPRQGDGGYFELMRERVRVLSAQSAPSIRGYYADNLRDKPGFDSPATRYGHALALIRTHQPADAIGELQPLVAAQPGSVPLRLALSKAEQQAGQHAAALAGYERLNRDFPGNRAVVLGYADALLAQGGDAGARR